MNKIVGGGLVLAGILLVVIGYFIGSSLIEWLLDVIGFVVIAGGVIVGIYGLIKMFSGGGRGESEY